MSQVWLPRPPNRDALQQAEAPHPVSGVGNVQARSEGVPGDSANLRNPVVEPDEKKRKLGPIVRLGECLNRFLSNEAVAVTGRDGDDGEVLRCPTM